MRDTIPGARITVIEGRGHEIYVDKPEEMYCCADEIPTFAVTYTTYSDSSIPVDS